jgi:hypothetical protein
MSINFDELWQTAVSDASRRLMAESPSAAPLASRVASPSFPGALTLLSRPATGGRSSGDFLREVSHAVATTAEVKGQGLDAAAVAKLFSTLFVRRGSPSSTGVSNDVLGLVVQKALQHEKLQVSESELQEIVQLLETGQFFGDLIGTAGAIFSTIPKLPAALLKDIPSLVSLPAAGIGGIFGDVFQLLESINAVADDLKDGKLDEPPPAMSRTLALLYGFGTATQIRDLLARILAPENRSVRLALLLYARANGFDISEQQLDVVYGNLVNTDRPNLGPVLAEGLEFMKSRYGGAELEAALAALQRGPVQT